MEYINIKFVTGILILTFLAALAVTQENTLNPAECANVIPDIRTTMGYDIFSTSQ